MQKEAVKIVETLQNKGFECYFAGGSVRDLLLGNDPKDIDIATSASTDQVQELFPNNIPIGKQFGVILVKGERGTYEVATFREEGPYLDSRRPSFVKFTSAKRDAERRDFTINGLFYDPIGEKIIDYVGGQEDIKKRIIRFIGDPDERIREDNLRLIRAIRFKNTLDFQYAENTFQKITKNAGLIGNVSVERVRDELNKILVSARRDVGLAELIESGITGKILPEIDAMRGVPQPIEYHHEGDVFTHTYLAIKSLPEDAASHLVWAVLLHDIGKPKTLTHQDGRIVFHDHAQVSAETAGRILKRLRFPNYEIKTICWLIENHMKITQIPVMRPVKQMNLLLDHRFPDLIKLCEADSRGTYPVNLDLVKLMKKELREAERKMAEIEEKKKKTKLFTGDNLIKLGYAPSHQFQIILDDINDQILSGKISSTNQAAEFVREKYINHQ